MLGCSTSFPFEMHTNNKSFSISRSMTVRDRFLQIYLSSPAFLSVAGTIYLHNSYAVNCYFINTFSGFAFRHSASKINSILPQFLAEYFCLRMARIREGMDSCKMQLWPPGNFFLLTKPTKIHLNGGGLTFLAQPNAERCNG